MPSVLTLDNESAVYEYISVFLPKTQAVQLTRTILHHQRHHGDEWLINYLKSLKNDFRNSFVNPERNLDKQPKGSFKPVWKLPLQKGLQLLNIYTCCKLKHITKAQAEKFINAVEAPKTLHTCLYVDRDIVHSAKAQLSKLEWISPYYWIRSPGKRAPHWVDGKLSTTSEISLSYSDLVADLYYCDDATKELVSKYIAVYAKALGVSTLSIRGALLGPKKSYWDAHDNDVSWNTETGSPLVGKLGFIQEKGGKLRVVANTFRFHQAVLGPLGDFLLGTIRDLSWDCTFDQEKGVNFAHDSLVAGKLVYSYDLSNATDTFPLHYQMSLLAQLISIISAEDQGFLGLGSLPKNDNDKLTTFKELCNICSIFQIISRGEWSSEPLSPFTNKPTISWLQGQPLGIYPSFALFALAHGNLVRSIEASLGLSDTFRILGDDIIINNSKVAIAYRSAMKSMGCLIHPTKSVISREIAEFAGKVITVNGALSVQKWSNFRLCDPLAPLRVLGYAGRKFVPIAKVKKILLFASLPTPIGLGINPNGLPLDIRLTPNVLDWLIGGSKYAKVNDTTLSYRDRKETLTITLDSKMIPERRSPAPQRTTWRIQEAPADQASAYTRWQIDHFNSVIATLSGGENLPVKMMEFDSGSTPNRANPVSKYVPDRNVLNKVYKYFRSFTKKT